MGDGPPATTALFIRHATASSGQSAHETQHQNSRASDVNGTEADRWLASRISQPAEGRAWVGTPITAGETASLA